MELKDSIKSQIEKIRHQFPTEQALLIPLLHAIQEEHGWVSMDAMRAAAQYLHLPLSKVREVMTFYTMFKPEPTGKVNLQVCTNLSCWLSGSEKLMNCLEKRLGIKCGETTSDGRFTLSHVECLASCGTAPVVQVNDDYFEDLDVPEIESMMDDWEAEMKSGNFRIGKSSREGHANG
jgi:NADH-quinone oxidoreductase subunit E